MRILFFGTPLFAVPTLTQLLASAHEVVGVVTQPDRARGRGQKIVPQAVKAAAAGHPLPIVQPERLKDPALLDALRDLRPDLGVVAAYGRILPAEILSLPRLGLINVHSSLLPRWRGAAPIHRAILAGDARTGVSIMRVVQALDAGAVLARATTMIDADETSEELEQRLATLGAGLLVETVDRIAAGPVDEEPQNEEDVTYAARLERRESQIDWTRPARAIHDQIRGLQPWPLATCLIGQRRVILLRSHVDDVDPTDALPGTIVDVTRDAISVASQSGLVRILRVQPEGRAAMSVRDFLNGTRVSAGDRCLPVPGL